MKIQLVESGARVLQRQAMEEAARERPGEAFGRSEWDGVRSEDELAELIA
jgi:hypothetical protein